MEKIPPFFLLSSRFPALLLAFSLRLVTHVTIAVSRGLFSIAQEVQNLSFVITRHLPTTFRQPVPGVQLVNITATVHRAERSPHFLAALCVAVY